MTTRSKGAKPPAKQTAPVHVEQAAGAAKDLSQKVIAFACVQPIQLSALVSAMHAPAAFRAGRTDLDVQSFADVIEFQAALVQAGDLSEVEASLMGQASALLAMFAELSVKAAQAGEMEKKTAFYGLALRAQGQANATLKTLIELKQPRQAVFAKNAAVHQGSGTQQVAMGVPAASQAHAREPLSTQNEVLTHEEAHVLDPATPRRAGRRNQPLEAVGEVHRSAHARGEGRG